MSKQCATCSSDADDDARSCLACGGLFPSIDPPYAHVRALFARNHPIQAAIAGAALSAIWFIRRRRRRDHGP